MQKHSDGEFFAYVKESLPKSLLETDTYSDEVLQRLLPTIKERVHVKTEITAMAESGEYDFAFMTPDVEASLLKWKNDKDEKDALPRLLKALELLENADFNSSESIKAAVWAYAEEIGRGELLWPLRVALTGRERSPDPFISAYIIGKEQTIIRIKNACAKIGG